MKKRISVIVPIFNVEQFLSRSLDSILNQTYRNIEIILIDDGSTDHSGAICDKYEERDTRVKVIHQTNRGVSSARNAGLDIATGDYISFVDPDDWIEPDMYQKLTDYLSVGEVDIVRFNALRKGEVLNWLPFEGYYQGDRLENEVALPMIGSKEFGGMFILGVLWMHLYKREFIDRHTVRFNVELRRCEDRLFTIQSVMCAHNMLFINDTFYHYEVYDESLSNRYDPSRWQQECIFLESLRELYIKNKNVIFVKEADRRIANDCILRVVTSVNQEYFSNNQNSFWKRYLNVKTIISSTQVRLASGKMNSGEIGLKGQLIIWLVRKRQAFLLSIFNTIILLKNKLKTNG